MSEPAGDTDTDVDAAAANGGGLPQGRGAAPPPNPDPLEGDVDLWWFEKPRSSTLCFFASVGLSVACMIGAVVIIVDVSYAQVNWQFGAAIFLCMWSFLVVFKLLVISTVHHMSFVYRRSTVSFLMDGGGLDVIIFLLSGAGGVIAGSAMLVVAQQRNSGAAAWTAMHGVAVVLLAGGGIILVATVVYGVTTRAFVLLASCMVLTTRRLLARLATTREGPAATQPVEQTASTANLVV
ncbi:transmembrane protein 125 [Lethenteron reissneri]|uniref:transmembrane protein 125 n=1 Tax=Lethenteron reissneri TaxID=7753 RepID=UPI002AB7BD16|nr:transmembrane protein 125 [Lethenteron reissneri]XP_061423516.1 transmembrane protein 125 [Lethenteron reissneri]